MAIQSARSASKPSLSHPDNAEQVVLSTPSGSSKHIPTKFALLIGCRYKDNAVQHELEQTHEDVHKMKALLKEVYGFEEINIIVLLDDGKHQLPTRENIIKAMKELVDGRKAGDELFLHYSGHGEQTPCEEGDDTEPDGFDEAIVPCDATRDKETWIIDNEMRKLLVCKIPVGAQLTAFFDMCHSGTILDLIHYCYADEIPESGPTTNHASIHVCKRTSHDKVEDKVGRLNELRPYTTAARTDSEDNKVRQGVRRFSYSTRENTELCELSEDSVVASPSGAPEGKPSALPHRSSSCASCGGRRYSADPPFVPKRPSWYRSLPHRRNKILPAIDDTQNPPLSRRYTEPPSPKLKEGCLSTLRSHWSSLLQKGFCRPAHSVGVEKVNQDEVHGTLIREGTSTSSTPLMSRTPTPNHTVAPVVPLPTKARSSRSSISAILNPINEDRETTPSGNFKYGYDIARCMSPMSSPSSQESLTTFGLPVEAPALPQPQPQPLPTPNADAPPERPGKCKCRPNPDPAHGQVICISAASDEQISWETPKGSLTSALVDILMKDSHPTYKGLLGSMQSILNNVSDNLRQEHIRTTKRKFMEKRKGPKRKKAILPSRKSTPSSRKGSTKSRTSTDNFGEAILFAMGETVKQAQGGPIQRPMIGTESRIDMNTERFMKRHFCRSKHNSNS